MAFEDEDNPYRDFSVGDLVYFHEAYVIPPDAVNWKLSEPDTSDNLAIIVDENAAQWDMQPYGKHRLYKIMHVKSGTYRTCSTHNLRKAYFYDEIENE